MAQMARDLKILYGVSFPGHDTPEIAKLIGRGMTRLVAAFNNPHTILKLVCQVFFEASSRREQEITLYGGLILWPPLWGLIDCLICSKSHPNPQELRNFCHIPAKLRPKPSWVGCIIGFDKPNNKPNKTQVSLHIATSQLSSGQSQAG